MKLTKEQYDALPDSMKALFKAEGDGYVSTFATAEEVEGLRTNNAALLAEKKEAQEKETAAQKSAREAQEKADREAGNIAALDKSWGEKLEQQKQAYEGQLAHYKTAVQKSTVGNAATELAAKLFGPHAGLMRSHVLERLTMEEKDGDFAVRVLKDGKPSALSLDDLAKEFQGNKDFAPVLVGSGSGGGPRLPTTPVEQKGQIQSPMDDLRKQALELMGDD